MPGLLELLHRRGLPKMCRVKVVRHQDARYDLPALIARGHFESGYQAYQGAPVFNCDYIASCIGLPHFQARFFGVYRVLAQRPGAEVPLPPDLQYLKHIDPATWALPSLIWYDLVKQDGFDDLENEVVIDWGRAVRTWHQWLTPRTDKAVVQMPAGLAG